MTCSTLAGKDQKWSFGEQGKELRSGTSEGRLGRSQEIQKGDGLTEMQAILSRSDGACRTR